MPQHTGFGHGADSRSDDPLEGYEPSFSREASGLTPGSSHSREWEAAVEPADEIIDDPHVELLEPALPPYMRPQAYGRHSTLARSWMDRPWKAIAAVCALLVVGVGLALWPVFGGGEAATSVRTGTLVVSSHPSAAAVSIDGAIAGTTPLAVDLPEGDHTVAVGLWASGTRSFTVAIRAGEQATQHVQVEDPPAAAASSTGVLRVESDPAGAKVTIGGRSYGATPVTIDDLAPGPHVVQVRSDGGTAERSVSVTAGATSSLFVSLSGAAGLPVAGWIAPPKGPVFQIFEGDRLLGSSAQDRIMVSAGRHALTLVNEALGYRAEQTLVVAPGVNTPLRVDWPHTGVNINAQPWADISVDGESRGQTPLGELKLSVGTHQVQFSHPNFGSRTVELMVRLGAPNRLSVDMRK